MQSTQDCQHLKPSRDRRQATTTARLSVRECVCHSVQRDACRRVRRRAQIHVPAGAPIRAPLLARARVRGHALKRVLADARVVLVVLADVLDALGLVIHLVHKDVRTLAMGPALEVALHGPIKRVDV